MRAFRIQHDVRWYAVVLLLLGGTCTVASDCAAGQFLLTETVSATVTCSGGCLCQPSTGTISGTISDGPSNYANFANCTWLIASSGPSFSSFNTINLSFSSFITETNYDFVTINRCTSSSSCEQVAKLTGASLPSSIYTSSTGYMQVLLTSDKSTPAPGFVASWSSWTSTCIACPAGESEIPPRQCAKCMSVWWETSRMYRDP
jgi:ferredoxin